jgi:hypothetical protein
VSDNITANKSKIKNDVLNLKEILDAAEDIKKRYRDIFVQISDRQALLNDINQGFENYETSYKSETKWITLLEQQIEEYESKQVIYKQKKVEIRKKYQPNDQVTLNDLEEDINELKNSLDPVAVSIVFYLN